MHTDSLKIQVLCQCVEANALIFSLTYKPQVLQQEWKKKLLVWYFFGQIDFVGQGMKLEPDQRLLAAKIVFSNVLKMDDGNADQAIDLAIEGSQCAEGQKCMKHGAKWFAKAVQKSDPTENSAKPLRYLLSCSSLKVAIEMIDSDLEYKLVKSGESAFLA